MLIRPATREYRSWTVDSRRWDAYRPREGDVIVATYPKCGTTWMHRVAAFLGITVAEEKWPLLIEAASLKAMREQGGQLMPNVTALFDKGAETFFNKGTNGRWKGVFRSGDLALYDAKIARHFSPACAAWHAGGRKSAGDPRKI